MPKTVEKSDEEEIIVKIDIITKLPKSKGQDSILIIVDYYTGKIRATACREVINAREIWQKVWKVAWRVIGLLRVLVTDRGAIFTSRWWKKEMEKERIDYRKTTSYYPQANSLAERING